MHKAPKFPRVSHAQRRKLLTEYERKLSGRQWVKLRKQLQAIMRRANLVAKVQPNA